MNDLKNKVAVVTAGAAGSAAPLPCGSQKKRPSWRFWAETTGKN